MSWLKWIRFGDIPSQAVIYNGVEYLKEERKSPDIANKYEIRDRAIGSWTFRGPDRETADAWAYSWRPSVFAKTLAPYVGKKFLTYGAAVEGSNSIAVKNMTPTGLTVKQGWRFQVAGDPTVYEVTAEAAIASAVAITNVLSTGLTLSTNHQMRVDDVSNYIFLIENAANKIHRCSKTGTGLTAIYTGATYGPSCIALAHSAPYVFFGQYDGSGYDINRMAYDGSGLVTIIEGAADYRVVVDDARYYLWVLQTYNRVHLFSYGGSDALENRTVADNPHSMYCRASDGALITAGAAEIAVSTEDGKTTILTAATVFGTGTTIRAMAYDATQDTIFFTIGTAGVNRGMYSMSAGGRNIFKLTGLDPYYISHVSTDQQVFTLYGNDIYKFGVYGVNATLSVSPPVSKLAAAAGDNADVYFFAPTSAASVRANEADGFTIALKGEYVTEWEESLNAEVEQDEV